MSAQPCEVAAAGALALLAGESVQLESKPCRKYERGLAHNEPINEMKLRIAVARFGDGERDFLLVQKAVLRSNDSQYDKRQLMAFWDRIKTKPVPKVTLKFSRLLAADESLAAAGEEVEVDEGQEIVVVGGGRKVTQEEAEQATREWLGSHGEQVDTFGLDRTWLVKPISLVDIGFGVSKIDALLAALQAGIAAASGHEGIFGIWQHPFDSSVPLVGVGYNTYIRTPRGTLHNGRDQAKVTMMIAAPDLHLYCQVLPYLSELVWRVGQLVPKDCQLIRVHVLKQAQKGQGRQALFGWHVDNETESRASLSFVFSLTAGHSSMAVATAENAFNYCGQGCGCMFLSQMHHASGVASEGTIKVALFYQPKI